jgi:PIN domain nuclease of toxin-antitoxin system
MVILDTHIWIWLINGDSKIEKPSILNLINDSVKNNDIFIPAICLWEVAMSASKKRISLSEDTLSWIKKASAAPGISVYPLTAEIAYESTQLPGDFHGDPADRLITATARITDGTLITFDKQILKYSKEGFVKTQS